MSQSEVSSPLVVTAAVIRDRDRVLIVRRPLTASNEAGKWEFPGGKVEAGEHPEVSIVREIREELEMNIQVERFFDLVSHVYHRAEGSLHIILLCYVCQWLGGGPRAVEASEMKWVSRDELGRIEPIAAADVALFERLSREWV